MRSRYPAGKRHRNGSRSDGKMRNRNQKVVRAVPGAWRESSAYFTIPVAREKAQLHTP